MNIDEDFYQRVNAVGLEVDDDGRLPVPLGETMAQTLQEMEERGVITPSQIVDAGAGCWPPVDPGWQQEIELATKRDAEQVEDPMKALYEFLNGRTVGIALVGRAQTFHWRWRGEGFDEGHEDLDPDEVLTFSRLAVDAMRAGQ